MSFPTELLDWMVSKVLPDPSLPNLLATGHGSRQDGYFAADGPPAGHFNRIFYIVSKWIAFLNGIENETLTWGVPQHYDMSIAGDDTTPDIVSDAVPTVRKVWIKAPFSVAGDYVSFYHSAAGEFAIVLNATWVPGTSKWHQDNAARVSLILRATLGGGFGFQSKPLGSSDWIDNAWGYSAALASLGGVIAGAGLIDTFVNSQIARFQAPRAPVDSVSPRTLISLLSGILDSEFVSWYRANDENGNESLELAFGCYYSSVGNWSQSPSATHAPTLISISRNRIRVAMRTATTTTWTDDAAGWDLGYPLFALQYGTNYGGTTGFRNTLAHANIPKVLARLVFSGTGANVPTLDSGAQFNSLSVSSPSTDIIRLTFAQNFAAGYIAQPLMGEYSVAKIGAVNVAGNTGIVLPVIASGPTVAHIDFALYGAVVVAGTPTIGVVNITSGGAGNMFTGVVNIVGYGAQ